MLFKFKTYQLRGHASTWSKMCSNFHVSPEGDGMTSSSSKETTSQQAWNVGCASWETCWLEQRWVCQPTEIALGRWSAPAKHHCQNLLVALTWAHLNPHVQLFQEELRLRCGKVGERTGQCSERNRSEHHGWTAGGQFHPSPDIVIQLIRQSTVQANNIQHTTCKGFGNLHLTVVCPLWCPQDLQETFDTNSFSK